MEVVSVPAFQLENGQTIQDAPVAYKTWGALNEARDNVILVCHALTGDVNADRWWGALIGPGAPFDTNRYFVICLNVIGSPYGTLSPLTINPETGRAYGADFPDVTIRDTVALHKAALDLLGIRGIALAAGGSMGAMQVLEWAFFGSYVRAIAAFAVGARHSAWCIGWSEAQRQAIYADPGWMGGRYEGTPGPVGGLAAARMMAMVSYRSRASFASRFGRDRMGGAEVPFAVESYLRYQGEKLVNRFDANCYVNLTRQMDTHDVSRGRHPDALRSCLQPALVVGIDSDVLYPLIEQRELADALPNGELHVLRSVHGHDAFLIELEDIEAILRPWLELNLVPSYHAVAAA